MLTVEEQERRAYISGNVELAAAFGASMDLKREADALEEQLQVADERIAELEQELADARA